jgi:hypothetical protein
LASRLIRVSLLCFLLFLSVQARAGAAQAAESQLAVVDAGVQASEDAPFVTTDYRFMPGEYVYFTFQIAGFAIKSEERGEVRRISLTYEVETQDANGVALAPSVSDKVQTDLSPEDKNWLPKRRASFLIPSFLAAGEYRVHVTVRDVFGKTEAAANYPFRVGGVGVQASPVLTVQNFGFLRSEGDREPLSVAAYRPGDTVYARFEMVGYKLGPNNAYDLSYGLTVLRPNGKPFFQDPKAAELRSDSFYPAQFLPGTIELTTTPDTARGEYVIILTVRDLIGNQTYELKRAFSVE